MCKRCTFYRTLNNYIMCNIILELAGWLSSDFEQVFKDYRKAVSGW